MLRRVLVAVVALSGCDKLLGLDPVQAYIPGAFVLSFDNSSSNTDLVDFPVLVSLDSTVIDYGRIEDPDFDLRFADSSGDLPFEVEHWDPNGESAVWVRVGKIHAGSTTDYISMYTGLDAGGSAASPGVWTDFAFVYHCADPRDSVDTSDLGVVAGSPSFVPGRIGTALQLDGTTPGQHVAFSKARSLLGGWNMFTIELWFQPQYSEPPILNNAEPHVLADTGGPADLGRVFNSSKVNGAPLVMQMDFHFANNDQQPQLYVPTNRWSYVVFAYDGQTLWIYRNGVALDTRANSAPEALAATLGTGIFIGGESGYRPLAGPIDEVRVSRAFHSEDWVLAQYLSMSRHFVSFAPM